jgi:DNA-binding FadR family transcriptional regulator
MRKKSRFSITVKKQTLADQVAEAISEGILSGDWQPGDALPTEPELSQEFGVSRAVVRDATRMLVARGLVEAQHGRGVFVTESQTKALNDALLLALRRSGATVWDVEQFEQMVFPEVCALAAIEAAAVEITQIEQLAKEYIEVFSKTTEQYWHDEQSIPAVESAANRHAFLSFIQAIFTATHNGVWQLLAGPVLQLRSTRNWEVQGLTAQTIITKERDFLTKVVEAISSGDPEFARTVVKDLMQLPSEAIEAMRQTTIGETTHIRLGE